MVSVCLCLADISCSVCRRWVSIINDHTFSRRKTLLQRNSLLVACVQDIQADMYIFRKVLMIKCRLSACLYSYKNNYFFSVHIHPLHSICHRRRQYHFRRCQCWAVTGRRTIPYMINMSLALIIADQFILFHENLIRGVSFFILTVFQ